MYKETHIKAGWYRSSPKNNGNTNWHKEPDITGKRYKPIGPQTVYDIKKYGNGELLPRYLPCTDTIFQEMYEHKYLNPVIYTGIHVFTNHDIARINTLNQKFNPKLKTINCIAYLHDLIGVSEHREAVFSKIWIPIQKGEPQC